MIYKTLTYTDFNGVERTESFGFNLTNTELLEMDVEHEGGMKGMVERIVATTDAKAIFQILKDIVLRSYGVKSDDGRRFIKSPELSAEFSQTEAFSELMVALLKGDIDAAEFVQGIVPAKLAQEAASEIEAAKLQPSALQAGKFGKTSALANKA